MGTQGAPCPQHEDGWVPLSFPCSSGSPRGLRREEDPALRRSSAHPHPPPPWGLGVKVPCRARWEQQGGGKLPRLQRQDGAGLSSSCSWREETLWRGVVLARGTAPGLSSLSGTPAPAEDGEEMFP